MRDDLSREKMHKAIDSTLSGLKGDPWLFQRISARAAEGEPRVKKRLSAGLVLAIVLLLVAAVAAAVTLLSKPEIVQNVMEEKAVPLATKNDTGTLVNNMYSAEELAELIRGLNESGFTLEENNRIMQAIQNGHGYYEEEAIMEICRQAFGGNLATWTLEQQDWFERLLVDIGFSESYESCLPGEGNMTYEAAEAYAFRKIREAYGEDLPLENRDFWQLSRSFYREDPNDPASAVWNFTLDPKDLDHGQYYISFEDKNPDETAYVYANIRDWSQPYTADELLSTFQYVYGWSQGKWPQEVWQKLHEMLQKAEMNPDSREAQDLKAYAITDYPVPDGNEISRETAVENARKALDNSNAALDGAVLAEYEGERSWMVSFVILAPDDGTEDESAGLFVISVNSATGDIISTRKKSLDDSGAIAYVPETAYVKAWDGILRRSDIINLAAEAILKEYPGLDLMNTDKYEAHADSFRNWNVVFKARDIHLGNATATVTRGGDVSDITADTETLNGDNLWKRYSQVYGYFGNWDQNIWVQLEKDMSGLDPAGIDGKLLKATHYPEEASVTIQREQAKEAAQKAAGKRYSEVNTCVLVDANPHPVWIMRVITDDPDDPVFGIDAETGNVVFTETNKVDYTPKYVLYSLPQVWRKTELEMLGAPYMAKVAITYKFGDMWLDDPELDVDNTACWELQQEGLTVRYIGRWKGLKSYEVELDENGFVIRCEETESSSTEEMPEELSSEYEHG